jgi:hypothetical protein
MRDQDLGFSIPTMGRADLEGYLWLCEQGLFYESLMNSREKCKSALKKRVLTIFYRSHKDDRYPSALAAVMWTKFRSVMHMLADIKRNDHRRAAWLMQNAESTLMIHRICGRILRERPGIILFTLHDALVTTPGHIRYVRRVAMEEFRRIGVGVTLRHTRCIAEG